MRWRDNHFCVGELYEHRRLRLLEQLGDSEPGVDLTLPTDRPDDFEPARVYPSRSAPSAGPTSLAGKVPNELAGRRGEPRPASHGTPDHDLPPAA